MNEVQPNNPASSRADTRPERFNRWRDLTFLIIGSGVLIALDQWTKRLVLTNIPFGNAYLPDYLSPLSDYFRFVHWRNSGAAFGLFQDGNLIFTFLAILATILIVTFFPSVDRREWGIRLAMLFQLGGAVGNLIDRIRFGYVIDFISVAEFPVFNIADACISIGVAILLIDVLITELRDKRAGDQHTDTQAAASDG